MFLATVQSEIPQGWVAAARLARGASTGLTPGGVDNNLLSLDCALCPRQKCLDARQSSRRLHGREHRPGPSDLRQVEHRWPQPGVVRHAVEGKSDRRYDRNRSGNYSDWSEVFHRSPPSRPPRNRSLRWVVSHFECGPDAVRFYTKTKTVSCRWPSGVKEGASFVITTMT
jgi:hypothetical protein